MNRRQTEGRGCLHTLPRCEGGKACEAGLKMKDGLTHGNIISLLNKKGVHEGHLFSLYA